MLVTRVRLASTALLLALAAATAALASERGAALPRLVVLPQSDAKESPGLEDAARIVRPVPQDAMQASPYGQTLVWEREPNDTASRATPLGGSNVVAAGSVFPVLNPDFWSFTAVAGDRVYAATMTAFAPVGASVDSTLAIIATNGTTVLESDDDNGTLTGLASTISGTVIPTSGTYYVRVNGFNTTRPLTPYHLHFRLQSGAPTTETEPNDTTATATPLPPTGYISGTVSSPTDGDVFSLVLSAGATVSLSLDLDPERNAVTWDGRLGGGEFGGQFLVVNDDGGSDAIPSEALFLTVPTAGTYYCYVDAASGGGATATYRLSVSVHAAAAGTCVTVASTDVPKAIPDGGSATSVLTVPGAPIVGEAIVALNITHAQMPDLDITLISPEGNENGLLADMGFPTYTTLDLRLTDDAAIPVTMTPLLQGLTLQPGGCGSGVGCGGDYRLAWFRGEDAGGVFTLDMEDDTANATGGTLNSWSVTVCQPPAAPSCPIGTTPITIFSTDFEANDGAFSHVGTADEWEWGTPSSAPVTGCGSGINCWKTDLTGTYDLSSDQTLESPTISLAGVTGPIRLSWAQSFQMEGASFDHAWVDVVQIGGIQSARVWMFQDGTMHTPQGTTMVQESAGWGAMTADISAFAGKNIRIRFHLDSDNIQNFAGLAVDDVTVAACDCAAITVQPATLPGGKVGVAYTQTLTATGGTAPYTFARTAGTLPTGLTLTTAGVLSGTPTVTGTFNFTITATDANGCTGSLAYAVTVTTCAAITVNPPALSPGWVGAAYAATLTATGGTAPHTFGLTSGTLPPGLSLSSAGVISGTPTLKGAYPFTARATDASGCTGSRAYTFVIRRAVNYVVGEGLGLPNGNRVKFYTGTGGVTPVTITAYSANAWGVNVAGGDLDRGADAEILTGPGPGAVYGCQVKAFRRDGTPIGKINFFAYGTFKYGVNVASGDVEGDIYDEIITGAGPGDVFGPHVRGFNYDGVIQQPIGKINFFAYNTPKYGVNVGTGDLDGDVIDEIVTGAGPSPAFAPTVRAFNCDGFTATSINKINFDAFTYTGYGVNVAAGDVDVDGFAEIAATPGPGPSHPSRFRGFNYDNLPLAPIAAYDTTPFLTLYGGRVGEGDVSQDNRDDLLCGAGRDVAADSTVKAYNFVTGSLVQLAGQFLPFAPDTYGVNVAASELGY